MLKGSHWKARAERFKLERSRSGALTHSLGDDEGSESLHDSSFAAEQSEGASLDDRAFARPSSRERRIILVGGPARELT